MINTVNLTAEKSHQASSSAAGWSTVPHRRETVDELLGECWAFPGGKKLLPNQRREESKIVINS